MIKKVIITEKLFYPKFIVKKENNTISFCKKHYKEISILDRTLSKIYEYPIYFFKKIDKTKFKNNYNYHFYYDFIKNNLILFKINNKNELLLDVKDKLDLDNISYMPIIYEGNYTEYIKELLESKKDIKEIVNSINTDFENINSIDISYIDENEKIINQINLNNLSNERISSDLNGLIISNIIRYVNNFNLDSIKLDYNKEKGFDNYYIELIEKLYKDYNKNVNVEFLDIFNNDIFKLNYKFLNIKNIENENLFKLFLNTLYNYKNYNSFLINEDDKNILKNLIYIIKDKINNFISSKNKKIVFKTFDDFIKK